MRRIALALVLALIAGVTIRAITYGTPDGDRHPNVGLLVGFVSSPEILVCSERWSPRRFS